MKIASRSYTKVLLPLPTKVMDSHAVSYLHVTLLILLRNHQTHPCRIMKIRPSAMKRPVPEPKQKSAKIGKLRHQCRLKLLRVTKTSPQSIVSYYNHMQK